MQTKKRKSTVLNQSNPKIVSPVQCDWDFPNECLEVRNNKLSSVVCREVVSLNKSCVKNHIGSGDMHKDAKKRKLARKEVCECDIVERHYVCNKLVEPAGANVSMEQRVNQVKAVKQ